MKNHNSILFKNFFKGKKASVWMSHQDAVFKIPKGFKNIASTNSSKYTAIENKKKIFMVFNFTLRLLILKKGFKIIKNFVLDICKIKKNWIIGMKKKIE